MMFQRFKQAVPFTGGRVRLLMLVAMVVASPSVRLLASEPKAARPPNVVLIYTDDQGYGDLSCQNEQSKFRTPHLDRLAREGIRFTDAHSSDTVCTPSRYGLLTGRYSWRTELKRGVFGAERACLITDGRLTLASLLQRQGYQTGMVGKWHLGMDFPGTPTTRDWSQPVRDMPLDKGFDYFFGVPASLNYGVLAWFEGRHAKVPPTLFTAKKPNRLAIADYRIRPPYERSAKAVVAALGKPGMEVAADFVDSECLTRFTDQAIAWMKRATDTAGKDKPFFLYLPYTSPHKPVIPLPQFRGQGKAGAYGEFMIETDHHVGRILKFLDDAGLSDNTLILFTSDNGPETTWKERITRFQHHSNGPFRDGKRSYFEGGHRVPFLIRWPAGITRPGRTCDQTVAQTDLLATLAELLEVTLPVDAGEDSQSFLPVLADPAHRLNRLPLVHHAAHGRFAIREGNWKLVLPHQRKPAELYDLASDPSEERNVVAEHADVVARLESKITDIVCRGRTGKGAPRRNDTGYWSDLAWLSEEQYDEATSRFMAGSANKRLPK